MRPRVVRTLSEADVIARWLATLAVRLDTSRYIGRDSTWVEVEIPHDLYDANWNTEGADQSPGRIARSIKYANTPGRMPPGMASYSEDDAMRGVRKVFVNDGNHRAYAAYLRGDLAARFYMPANEWERFLTTIERPPTAGTEAP